MQLTLRTAVLIGLFSIASATSVSPPPILPIIPPSPPSPHCNLQDKPRLIYMLSQTAAIYSNDGCTGSSRAFVVDGSNAGTCIEGDGTVSGLSVLLIGHNNTFQVSFTPSFPNPPLLFTLTLNSDGKQ